MNNLLNQINTRNTAENTPENTLEYMHNIQRELQTTAAFCEMLTTTKNDNMDTGTSVDALWNAVLTKDRRFDGVFWFGVKTTGIYCRPSCSSRTPKRENVLLFNSPDAAEEQGFRVCKRCRPNQYAATLDPEVALAHRVCHYIAEHLEHKPDAILGLEEIAHAFALSADHLQRKFVSVLGISPREYTDALKLSRFKHFVKSGLGVTEALYEAGFGSGSRLYEKSNARLGMTPASYKRGGKGAVIAVHTTNETRLGCLLVAATEKGLCHVALGDNAEVLHEKLRQDFAHAEFTTQISPQFQKWIHAIMDYITTMTPQAADALLSLPLDVRMTSFQARVWSLLRSIPFGETRTYSDVASYLGQPTASRAVASACASNPVALITPCHRVVRAGGEVSGYRWGVERKHRILESERQRHEPSGGANNADVMQDN